MHDECMDQMAKEVKRMRADIRDMQKRMAYPPHSSWNAYYDGISMGMTRVLELICQNPMED